jgi:aspartate racemase
LVYDFVQPKINIPILHIADATGEEAKSKGFKSLGLLGTKPTMTQTFLKTRLEEKYGMEVLTPQGKDLSQTHDYISKELTQGKFTQEAKEFYLKQIELFKSRGADAIILGCTELPMLLKQEDSPLPFLDTTRLHAQMAVDFILK